MKKLIGTLIFILLTLNAFAFQVNYEEASKVATMKLQVSDHKELNIANVNEMIGEQGEILAYVFDLNPVGFIVISTDTDIAPIVAYSFQTDFSMEKSNFNQGYIFIEKGMKLQQEANELIASDVKQANNEMWDKYLSGNEQYFLTRDVTWPPDEYGSSTEGWIELEWNQSPNPYYTFCPMDPGSGTRTVVGCVATAMAQIMYFHRYVGNPNFSSDSDDYWSTYTTPSIHLDNDHNVYDFPSYPELNVHLNDLADAFETNAEITDDMISAINFGAGVSVEMGYSSNGSGAYTGDVPYALLNKFDYDSAQLVSYINTTFYTNLQNNLMNAKPAFFGITGTNVGHAIICDGWNETDNTYHLNMGWGGNSNGWYTLPSGMPAGYNQISNAVINIDGGEPFVEVYGQVVAPGADLTLAHITLDGPRHYEIQVTEPPFFNIPWVKGGLYQATAIIELEAGGYFYKTYETTLNESNTSVAFILDNFEFIDGSVTASMNPENTSVAIYDGSQIVSEGLTDATGDFAIPGLLPGDYYATASLDGNYFDEQAFTVTTNNQTINFECLELGYDHFLGYSSEPTSQYQLLATMGVGIKVFGDVLIGHDDDALAKIAFVAPFSSDQGSITAEIWDGNTLVTDKEVTNFSEGNWKTIVFDNFVPIDTNKEYYVGYMVSSNSGVLPSAYHDDGPLIDGGAFIRIGGNWTSLNAGVFNYNFCIQGIAISTNPSSSDDNIVPANINALNQNYPNPFNPETTISYDLSKNSNVELSIYNLKGQIVRTLVNSSQISGHHETVWNGKDDSDKDVSSGIYLYKLNAGNKYISTKKMILLK